MSNSGARPPRERKRKLITHVVTSEEKELRRSARDRFNNSAVAKDTWHTTRYTARTKGSILRFALSKKHRIVTSYRGYVNFRCPNCFHTPTSTFSYLDKRVKCLHCHQWFLKKHLML